MYKKIISNVQNLRLENIFGDGIAKIKLAAEKHPEDYEKAIDLFDKCIENRYKLKESLFYRGKAQCLLVSILRKRKKKILKQAFGNLNKALEFDSKYIEAYYFRGRSYFEKFKTGLWRNSKSLNKSEADIGKAFELVCEKLQVLRSRRKSKKRTELINYLTALQDEINYWNRIIKNIVKEYSK